MSDTEEVEVKNKAGDVCCKYVKYDGILLPTSARPAQRIAQIQDLPFKKGNVLVCSYPKTGSHWVLDSASMLCKESPDLDAMPCMLDLTPKLDKVTAAETPLVMMTHFRPCHMPRQHIESGGKMLLVVRNPKDTAVSMFHFQRNIKLLNYQGSWDDFFEHFCNGQVVYSSYFDYYRDWEGFMKDHPDQVLLVTYEDMHKDYFGELKRMSEFLGLNRSDDVLRTIARKGRLDSVKQARTEDNVYTNMNARLSIDGSLLTYRKGQVGDWRNYFTVAQSEAFARLVEDKMRDSAFRFQYSI